MKLSAIFHQLRMAVDQPYRQALITAAWQEGIPSEIAFWDNYIATQGGMWPEDFAIRMDPQSPLQQNVIEVFPATAGRELKILDVGAGPLTYLGKVWPGHALAITAVDPLADEYAAIFAKHNLTPPVRTTRGVAKRLVEQFQ